MINLCFKTCSLESTLLDLENFSDDFVLETKKIEIPGVDHPFNPSIVRWRGSYVLSFRVILSIPEKSSALLSSSFSAIGVLFLDDELNVDSEVFYLDLRGQEGRVPRVDDARLINKDERLYLIYSDNQDEIVTEGGFRMVVAEIDFDGKTFLIKRCERLTSFPGMVNNRREKNWVPFDYKNNLLLSYSIEPHKVLMPLLDGREECVEVSCSKSSFPWKWGEIRGGTPALLDGDEYLAFFHSSIDLATVHSEGEIVPHYFIGAYRFEKEPPFTLTKMSQKPIIGKNFYHGERYTPYWKPVQVVFPCGFVIDGDYLYLTFGRQDHEVFIAKIDKLKLFKTLK